MTQRRIQLDAQSSTGADPRSRLKQIAGLILNLPYKDMVELGRMLHQEYSTIPPDAGLVALAERILEGQPAPHDERMPG